MTPARAQVLRVVVRVLLFWVIGGMSGVGAWAQAEESQPPGLTHKATKSLRLLKWRHVPAHGILLKDMKSGQTLYQFRAGVRLSPASLTKIMSALIILEQGNLNDEVVISERAARAHKVRLRLRPGQVFRLEDLLKAMLIVSANDACVAAVEHVASDEVSFVELMNTKAVALGLKDTHFGNPCGFDVPGHYTTAEDLATLSEIALENPIFRDLVRQERDLISPINGNRVYLLHNTNRLLGRVPGVEGVKTGFTSKAGRCLIAKVSQDGRELLLVLLGAKRRWTTASDLIKYGLTVLQLATPEFQISDRDQAYE
ncbi:MAG: D-alanyl-D-alanine carboxypeptidase family protein [Nitrospiraceae bacterium]